MRWNILIILIGGMFMISLVSATDISQLNGFKNGKFKVQSQDGIDQFYDIEFSDKLLSDDIEIKYCFNSAKLQEVKDGKLSLEKELNKSEYDKYVAPSEILVKVDDIEKYEQVSKEFIFFGKDCITITANPYETELIKLGFNSTYIVPEYQYTQDADKSNTTSVPTNYTYLEVDKSQLPYSNLVGYLSFDSDSLNDTAYDWSGYGNNGTYVGDIILNSSCTNGYGDCASGDGSTAYITLGNFSGIMLRNFTISFWMQVRGTPSTNDAVMGKPVATSWSGGWGSYITGTQLRFWVGAFGSSYANTTWNQDWTHYVFRDNGTALTIYKDGVEGTILSATTYPAINNNPFYILNNLGTADRSIPANIDEVMIFNDSVSYEDLLNIYRNQSDRFYSKGSFNIINQSYMNITSGDDKVNVSTSINRLLNTNISLSVNYYDGSWTSTQEQNISSDGINVFDISSSATNLTLNYSFYSSNQTVAFYTPLLIGKINFTTWTSGAPPSNSCTYTSGVWNIKASDWCNITSNVVGDGSNFVCSDTDGNGRLYVNNNVFISGFGYKKFDNGCYYQTIGNGGFR